MEALDEASVTQIGKIRLDQIGSAYLRGVLQGQRLVMDGPGSRGSPPRTEATTCQCEQFDSARWPNHVTGSTASAIERPVSAAASMRVLIVHIRRFSRVPN